MRAIKVYCPPGAEPPLYAFIDALDGKLKAKLLWQIFRLRNLSACELKEPHFKHFSLERYSQMYELREKGKVLIRIVFTVQNEDVILWSVQQCKCRMYGKGSISWLGRLYRRKRYRE